MYLAQIFTSKMFLWDISLIFANVCLIGTQFIVRLYEPLLIFSSQKCTMININNDFTITYTYIYIPIHIYRVRHIKCYRAIALKLLIISKNVSDISFTSQHSLSFKLLLGFMNSNTYSGNYCNKTKNAPLLKNTTKIYGKVLGASAILCYAMRLFCFKIRSNYVKNCKIM